MPVIAFWFDRGIKYCLCRDFLEKISERLLLESQFYSGDDQALKFSNCACIMPHAPDECVAVNDICTDGHVPPVQPF